MKWDPPIKNQGACGSCWAFAAVSAVENQYHKLKGNLTLFSEQYLVNCDNYDYGCNGGWPSNTFKWIRENGLVAQEVLPYIQRADICNDKLKQYEYRIVDEFTFYRPKIHKYEELLAYGPLVVGMDARFQGFMSYRPVNFDPIVPNRCGCSNHAVTVVATVTENGQKYIIARNSWGATWGYKGYFKMPFDKSCDMTQYAWLPIVYDGRVPDGKPEPKPVKSNCVTILGNKGYLDKIMVTCDSVTEVSTPDKNFGGIRFPKENDGGDLYISLFELPNCEGRTVFRTNSSREYFSFKAQSLAYNKKVSKERCADFYLKNCAVGEPELTVCNDVTDTQNYNYTRLKEINSIITDSIHCIRFFTEPNFKGRSYWYCAQTKFGLDTYLSDFKYFLKNNVVRSIKISYL
jgi:hypothetical protein